MKKKNIIPLVRVNKEKIQQLKEECLEITQKLEWNNVAIHHIQFLERLCLEEGKSILISKDGVATNV